MFSIRNKPNQAWQVAWTYWNVEISIRKYTFKLKSKTQVPDMDRSFHCRIPSEKWPDKRAAEHRFNKEKQLAAIAGSVRKLCPIGTRWKLLERDFVRIAPSLLAMNTNEPSLKLFPDKQELLWQRSQVYRTPICTIKSCNWVRVWFGKEDELNWIWFMRA